MTATIVTPDGKTREKDTGRFANQYKSEVGFDLGVQAPPETAFTRRYDNPKEKVEALTAELDKAVADFTEDPAKWREWLDASSTFHRYSFSNSLLIMIQRPDASRVAGYSRWQELGRQVRKGSKAISILAPKRANLPVLDARGNPVLDDNGKPKKEIRLVGVTGASVFALEDTEPIPGQEHKLHVSVAGLSETPPPGLVDDLEAAVRATGATVRYAPIHDGAHGYAARNAITGEVEVVIGSHLSEGGRAKTLAHELAHIKAGHLDADADGQMKYQTGPDGHRGMMEMEAESIAYILTRANGMESTADYSAGYLATWGSDKSAQQDTKTLAASAERIRKVAHELLTEHTWQNTGSDNIERSAAEKQAADTAAKERAKARRAKKAPTARKRAA